MNVQTMLKELEWLGVELRAIGENLEYEGREEAITPELLERLKAHKAALMAACSKKETVPEEAKQPEEFMRMRTAVDPEARKLFAAGWEPKKRCGKTIWKHPDSGFYCSQEMAVHFMDARIGNDRCKSGANGKG